MLTIVLLVASLIFALVTHEYAHYRAMRADGIRVVSAGLGLPIPPMLRVKRRGIEWTLSPWLLGAYVSPDYDDFHRMEHHTPYRRLAWHYGAGVTTNLGLGYALLCVHAISESWPAAGVYAALAAACYLFRHQVAAYIQPALALPVVGMLAYGLSLSWQKGQTGFGYAGLGDIVPEHLTGWSVAWLFGVISLCAGLLNLLPLYPMDNGRVVDHLLRRWFGNMTSRRFQQVGSAIALLTLAVAVGSDVWAIATAAL